MTKLKIKVTKSVLQKSMMCGFSDCHVSRNCAISVAVRDIFPHANTENTFIQPFGGWDESWIELPGIASEYICRFDRLSMTPKKRLNLPEIEFEIEIPDEVIEKINIEEIKTLLVNHPTLELA